MTPSVSLLDGRKYGYQWWMATITDDQNNQILLPYALGWGGQHIFVSQDYNLVIVVTADDDTDVSNLYIGEILDLIGQSFAPYN